MKKTEFLTVRITAELKTKLIELAERRDRTVGWIANMAITEYLERNAKGGGLG